MTMMGDALGKKTLLAQNVQCHPGTDRQNDSELIVLSLSLSLSLSLIFESLTLFCYISPPPTVRGTENS